MAALEYTGDLQELHSGFTGLDRKGREILDPVIESVGDRQQSGGQQIFPAPRAADLGKRADQAGDISQEVGRSSEGKR